MQLLSNARRIVGRTFKNIFRKEKIMKKNLAFLLAAILLVSSMLGLTAVAETETEPAQAPSQEITYFNLSVKADVELLCAVPAAGYARGEDGSFKGVELLVWEEASDSYIYGDENAVVLTPELGVAYIGAAPHMVFKYAGLAASEMSKVIYVRVVYTDENGLRSYGDVCDYSIAEFANNYLSAPNTEHKALVEKMIDYGYFAALYNKKSSYTSEEVKALGKVSVTVNIDGVNVFTQTTQLAKVGEEVTLAVPYVAGTTFLGWDESVVDGKVTMDADGVSVVASFRSKTYYDADADFYGEGMNLNTLDGPDSPVGSTGKATTTKDKYFSFTLTRPANTVSDLALNFSARTLSHGSEADDGSKTNYRHYHGLKTVADPDGEGLVFQFTNTEYGGYTFSIGNIASTGFGEEVAPIVNYSFRIGSINGRIGNLGAFYHRLRFYDSKTSDKVADLDTQFFRIIDGKIQIQKTKFKDWQDAITIPADDKMHQYVLSIDTRALTYTIYAEDESGNFYAAVDKAPIIHNSDFSKYYNDGKYDLGSFENFFKGSFGAGVNNTTKKHASSFTWTGGTNWGSGDSALVDLDGDGVATDKVMDGYVQNATSAWALVDGKLVKYDATKHTADQRYSPNYNVKAVQKYAEANCGVLLDDLKLTIGNVYGR